MTAGLKKERNSSIEALKLFGILIIVLSHVVQTLGISDNSFYAFNDYILQLDCSTTNFQQLILSMLRYCGSIGNTIFFVCSAWFLLDSKKTNNKKLLQMITDTWVVSIVILGIVLILRKMELNGILVLKSLFPLAFGNNWYVNCYLIFYAIHPFLNKLIYELNQRSVIRITISMTFLYLIYGFFMKIPSLLFGAGNSFYGSYLITWITIYFIMGYLKLYAEKLVINRRFNSVLVLFGMLGNFLLIIATNVIGLRFELLNNVVTIWNDTNNLFIIMSVIGLFNLVKQSYFVNKKINYISKLSLFIYIIHENLLLRKLYRPMMWRYIYINFGYDYILFWSLILTILVFTFGVFSSILYFESLHKAVVLLVNHIYPRLKRKWKVIEDYFMVISR